MQGLPSSGSGDRKASINLWQALSGGTELVDS